uniref:Uncharacterized protein n=1 Tax=Strigamia maritima TaxID=126957 RepID=T1JDS5_STRMM
IVHFFVNQDTAEPISNNSSPSLTSGRDKTGKSALHYCSENTSLACADELLSVDPDLVNAADSEGYTALHLAVINGNKILARFLISKKADVNAVDHEKHSLIHWATVCGELECLDLLIATGADASTPDMHGAYPIHYAAQMCGPKNDMGHNPTVGMEVLKKLINYNTDVHVRDQDGREPFLWAASAGSSDALLALVNAGTNVKSKDKDGLTALHCAASRGHNECLETLLSFCGMDVDIEDNNGCTSLFYAVTLGHADCTSLLLRYSANPNHQDLKGRTPAHCGASKGQLETLKILEKNLADLWKENQKGDLPLHDAVQSGRKELVLWLLAQRPGAPSYANNDGRTCLHIAAINNNVELCKILIDSGADVNPVMRSTKGQMMTPLDAALFRGNRGCANYLQLHGGTPAQKIGSERIRMSDTNSEPGQPEDQHSLQEKSESIQTEDLSEPSTIQKEIIQDSDQENEDGSVITANALQASGRRLEKIPEEEKDSLQVEADINPSVIERGNGKKTLGTPSIISEDTISIGQSVKDSGFSDNNRVYGRSDADDSDVLSSPAGITFIDNGAIVKRRPRRSKGRKDGNKETRATGEVSDSDEDIKASEVAKGKGSRNRKAIGREDKEVDSESMGSRNSMIGKGSRNRKSREEKASESESNLSRNSVMGKVNNGGQMIVSKRSKGKNENKAIFRPKTGIDKRSSLSSSSQTAYNNRLYQRERRIFQELLELKRVQLNADKREEDVLVKKLSDNYRHQGLTVVHTRFNEPYTFRNYEKYLYDQLRLLSDTTGYNGQQSIRIIYDGAKEAAKGKALNPTQCTERTYHCHHATHSYMVKKNRVVPPILPKINGYNSSAPNLKSKGKKKSAKDSDQDEGVMFEIKHGETVQKFALPTGELDKNKKYQLTFTLNPASERNSNEPVLKPLKSV